MNQILPQLDLEVLQEKVSAAAMSGAIKTIEDYYTGYNSPFRKAIEDDLKTKSVSYSLDLPDIIAQINQGISHEIDIIANTAISKSFIPMVSRFLTRLDVDVNFSDVLREFISAMKDEKGSEHEENYEVDVKLSTYNWYDVKISFEDYEYKLTLHEDHNTRKDPVKKYQVLSLPDKYGSSKYPKTMKMSLDGVTLEMPFTPDVLNDEFTSYVARLIMSGSKITMDTKYFQSDWFGSDECHCH